MFERLTPSDLSSLPEAVRAAVLAGQRQLAEEREARLRLAAREENLDHQNKDLEAQCHRLEYLIRELQKALFGKRSEKLDPDQRSLLFEDLETVVAEEQARQGITAASPPVTARRNLGRLPKHLPRIERVIEPESTACSEGCGEMVKIGEDCTERLDVIPAQFRVIRTIRPRYACKACGNGVRQAPGAPYLIEGGLPTEGLIAHVLIAKYADHCPLYRQAGIFARSGIELDRSTLAGWVGKASFHLAPIVDRLATHLKTSPVLQMDETPLPVLDPGRGKTKTGYLWPMMRDQRGWGGKDPPGVVYHYAPGRGGHHAEAFLTGFSGDRKSVV